MALAVAQGFSRGQYASAGLYDATHRIDAGAGVEWAVGVLGFFRVLVFLRSNV
jgi:hypothetical protein